MSNPKKTSSCNPVNVVVIAVLWCYCSFCGNENKLIKNISIQANDKKLAGLVWGGGRGECQEGEVFIIRSLSYSLSLQTEKNKNNFLKGIVQPFELKCVTRLIRSAVKNWRSGNFFEIF